MRSRRQARPSLVPQNSKTRMGNGVASIQSTEKECICRPKSSVNLTLYIHFNCVFCVDATPFPFAPTTVATLCNVALGFRCLVVAAGAAWPHLIVEKFASNNLEDSRNFSLA
jgi:hypothetical protein